MSSCPMKTLRPNTSPRHETAPGIRRHSGHTNLLRNVSAPIPRQSETLIAWKRIYIEQDNM